MIAARTTKQVGTRTSKGGSSLLRRPEDLVKILLPDRNACRLRRRLPFAISAQLTDLSEVASFERKRVIRSSVDLAWLAEPLGSLRVDAMLPDLMRWFVAFCGLAGGASVSGCVVVTREDDCRKYHVDWVGLRLIITYAGPGTEWVPNDALRREALHAPWRSLAAINGRIVPDARRVMVAGTGDVLLLKGESYPGNAGRGAVHRSPPIAETNGVRLLFKLTSPSKDCGDPECTTDHAEASRPDGVTQVVSGADDVR